MTFENSKNKDSRTIPFNTAVRRLFADMERQWPADRVFTNVDGRPYTCVPSVFGTVVDHLEPNDKRQRLDHLTFHSIRHTVATRLAA